DCARCHDHKIDPIAQRDYYAMLSFFQNVNHYRNGGPTDEVPLPTAPADARAKDPARVAVEEKHEGLRSRIAELEEHFRTLHPPAKVGQAEIARAIKSE